MAVNMTPDYSRLVADYSSQYDLYHANTTASDMNKYHYLYSALFLPLLIRISAYLKNFQIFQYKKGPHTDDRYIALPRGDLKPFNQLLDEAAICFLHINRATATRSYAAQYISDKQKLLGNTDGNADDFMKLFRPHQPSTVIYITSDMEYVGCTTNAFKRRTQHIHNLMRHYLDLERSTLPVYAKTRSQGIIAMAKLCILIPFEISSPLCKLTDEARSIRILCPPKNVRFGSFHHNSLRRRCMGSRERIRRRSGGIYIPSAPKSMRVDKTLFSITFRYEDSNVLKELVSTRIEDIAKVWYQHGIFTVTQGRFDNSCWTAILHAFRGSIFLRTDTNQELSINELYSLCSISPNDTTMDTIIIKIRYLARSTLHLANGSDLDTLQASFRHVPIPQQQISIYRMQYAIEFEPTNMRKRHLNILRSLCRKFKLKPLHSQYTLPIHYHHHLDMRKLHRCIPLIIKKIPLPRDIRVYITWLTKIVKKKALKNTKPKYLNHKGYIENFDETPWDHCIECTNSPRLWENAPRELVPMTEEQRCISMFPAQHPPLYIRCPALHYSCQTHPFTLRTKTWRIAKEGLSTFCSSLPDNLSITPEILDGLGRYCVMNRIHRNRANKHLAIITSADVNKTTRALKNFCVEPFDKNKGEVYISCPYMAWHLIKKTYDWTGDDPQYELVQNTTPSTIISEMALSWNQLYPGLKSKLPPLLKDGRLGLATAYQKYGKPEPKKRPVIDLKFDPTINIRKAIARAGIFCINHISGHGSFHLSHSTRLRIQLDQIQKYLTESTNHLQDPMLVMRSDDIEGFFTNVDVDAAILAHERIVQLYMAQFANKKKVGKRKYQATSRNSNKIFVPLAKSVKSAPGHYNTSKISGKYSTVILKEMTAIIRWTTQYRTFTLGKMILKQKFGLFQGCPLSVYLALSIAFVAEHEARLSTLGKAIRGLRYVDDKIGITIAENNPLMIQSAKDNLAEYNQFYHHSLSVKEELPVWTTPGISKYLYIGHILTNTGKQITREYYNKNWHHYNRAYPFRQVYKLEQHYGSYCDKMSIRGQRKGRLLAIIRSTDTIRLRQVLCEKLFEYTYGLGDPPTFTIQILRRLLTTLAIEQDQRDILHEIISAYKVIHRGVRLRERNIFRILPNLDTGSILNA